MVINGDIPGLENIYTKNELERSTIFSMGKSTISMVMFNSYVCFPEKKNYGTSPFSMGKSTNFRLGHLYHVANGGPVITRPGRFPSHGGFTHGEIRRVIPNVINAPSQALYNGKSPHVQMVNNG